MNLCLKKLIQGVIAAGLCRAVTSSTLLAAPVEYSGNGHYFDYVSASVTWSNAFTAAQQLSFMGVSGHLATLTSAGENSFVYNQVYLPNIPTASTSYSAWLGGYQSSTATSSADGWNWVTGAAWNYTQWGAGEPNDWGGRQEDKLVMWGTGDWNDWVNNLYGAGTGPTGFLVEYDVPEPSSLGLIGLGLVALLRKRRVG